MWWFAVIAIVGLLIGATMQPPPPQNPKPSDLDIPICEDGVIVKILFGTRIIRDANVIMQGDASSVAIKKKGGKK